MRARAEIWEGNGWIVLVDGRPTGQEVREDEARSIARWFNEAWPELQKRIKNDAALAQT